MKKNNEKTKKGTTKKIIIICIIIIILGRFAYKYDILFLIKTAYIYKNQTYVKDFDKYQEDYQNIADFIINYKDELFKTSKDNAIAVDYDNGIKMYNIDTGKEIKLSKKNQQSLENIDTSFYDQDYPLNCIYYKKNIIDFSSSGNFDVIFSINGKKPEGIGIPEKDKYNKYQIKKLADNWYTIRVTGVKDSFYQSEEYLNN